MYFLFGCVIVVTPGWRQVGNQEILPNSAESEDTIESSVSTVVKRGMHAMGAPRTDMSRYFKPAKARVFEMSDSEAEFHDTEVLTEQLYRDVRQVNGFGCVLIVRKGDDDGAARGESVGGCGGGEGR